MTHHDVTETGIIDDDRRFTINNNLEQSKQLTLYTDKREQASLGDVSTVTYQLELSRKRQYTNNSIMLPPTQFTNRKCNKYTQPRLTPFFNSEYGQMPI